MTPRSITSRTLAAALGGYALSALCAMALAVILPMPRNEAVITGILAAFLLCACAAIWAFSVRSAWRAWGGIALVSLVFGALYLIGSPS